MEAQGTENGGTENGGAETHKAVQRRSVEVEPLQGIGVKWVNTLEKAASMLRSIILMTATGALLGACNQKLDVRAGDAVINVEQSAMMTVSGQAAYRERIALRPGMVFTVTAIDVAIQDRIAPVLARSERTLNGEQVPLEFEIEIPLDSIDSRSMVSVHATIKDQDGNLRWTTDTAYPLDITAGDQSTGLLRLVAASGMPATAISVPPEELSGTEWFIVDVERSPIPADVKPTLIFGADGRLSGQSGCNTYSLSYTLDEEDFRTSQGITTKKLCTPERNRLEADVLAILNDPERLIKNSDGHLVISGKNGRHIRAASK